MELRSLLGSLCILLSIYAPAQTNPAAVENMQTPPRCYGVMKTAAPIQIDGKDDEEAWDRVPWTEEFVDIEGDIKPQPPYTTKVKMLWDDEHLYLYAKMEEPHIWGDLTERDTIIYHNNDFEIFIKPFEQQSFYYEIEVNPLNTILDLMMPKPYRLGGDAIMHWDVKDLRSAIHIEGTLNNADDTDKYWAIEMAIPFESFTTFSQNATPRINDSWRINFSRVQWQHETDSGRYSRKMEDGRLLPEDNWVWSPIGIVNMHYPERWGYITFIDTVQDVVLPRSYAAEKTAWNIFYRQQLYKKDHGKFADSPAALSMGQQALESDGKELVCNIFANRNGAGYVIEVRDPQDQLTVILDNFGHYSVNYE